MKQPVFENILVNHSLTSRNLDAFQCSSEINLKNTKKLTVSDPLYGSIFKGTTEQV